MICYDTSRKNVLTALQLTELLGKTKVIIVEKPSPSLEEDWPASENGFMFYSEFLLNAEKLIQPPLLQEGPPKDDDTLVIFWSSGTTGQPKGIYNRFAHLLNPDRCEIFVLLIMRGGIHPLSNY